VTALTIAESPPGLQPKTDKVKARQTALRLDLRAALPLVWWVLAWRSNTGNRAGVKE
jgi:hypothetical protein